MDNVEIRKIIRNRRKKIIGDNRKELSLQITKQALLSPILLKAQNIGIFISLNEEADTFYLRQRLKQLGKTLYLPYVVAKNEALLWLKDEDEYAPDNLGISAPVFRAEALFPAEQLDCVITPLVGFDDCGNRLGMGGGFYDRTFANCSAYLLGFAYEIQRETFKISAWDRRLNALATEKELYTFDFIDK